MKDVNHLCVNKKLLDSVLSWVKGTLVWTLKLLLLPRKTFMHRQLDITQLAQSQFEVALDSQKRSRRPQKDHTLKDHNDIKTIHLRRQQFEGEKGKKLVKFANK